MTLVAFAKDAKGASAKQRVVGTEKEKYALRCFLLRLGWIGDEFKNPRKHLMANLHGDSAFASGVRPAIHAA